LNWNRPRHLFEARPGENGSLRRKPGLVLCCLVMFFFSGGFFSCGIEELIFLEPVEDVSFIGVTQGRLTIPNTSASNYFRNFTIYYRIYLSDFSTTSITTNDERRNIHSNLASHYNVIEPYIIDENRVFTSTSIFTSRGYFPLYLSTDKTNGFAVHDLLTKQGYSPFPPVTPGGTISFDFTDSTIGPFMRLSYDTTSTTLFLFRASGDFTPLPDRQFFLRSDMFSTTTEVNADIEQKTGVTPQSAYVSLYIIAIGIDNSFSPVYSQPAHIGIFRLPD